MTMLTTITIWCLLTSFCTMYKVKPISKYNRFNPHAPGRIKNSVNVVTFNTGLAARLPFYEERKTPIIDALLASDADVLCLQEIWYAEDMIEIQTALQKKYPYSFSNIHNDDEILLDPLSLAKPPCEPAATLAVYQCFLARCNQADPLDRIDCLATICNGRSVLNQACLTCVQLSGEGSFLKKCVQPTGTVNAVTGPGLAIFSKLPMSSRVAIDLIPGKKRLPPRWLLSAQVKGLGTFGCTHLTYPSTRQYIDPEIPPLFASYEEENLNNTLEVLKYFQSTEKYIIAGDFNMSPDQSPLSPLVPEHYNLLLKSGLQNPYVETGGPATIGTVNPLSNLNGLYILDHIFHTGYKVIRTKRVFDELFDIEGQTVSLSDHYGVCTSFKRGPRKYRKYRINLTK